MDWTCTWQTGTDPETWDGCDNAAFYLQNGVLVCDQHLDPETEAVIMAEGAVFHV